jgi:phospholipid/cholesterol/gamma-HCH transport system ATP-binding protein
MITLSGVHKTVEGNHVLRGVDLKVGKGESMVIIGGSGSGKSVLIKCVLGLLTPDAGNIAIDGVRMTPKTQAGFLDRFGMLFQGGALFDSLPVWQNVAFRLLRSPQKADAKDIAIDKLAQVGLTADVADKYPSELSGGMQKRVGLARAIAANPEVIFFDEPTTGLDPIMAGVINDLIRNVVTDLGVTAITITHDMTSVNVIADQVAMLHDGEIRWTGAKSDLSNAQDPYLKQFIAGSTEGPIKARW